MSETIDFWRWQNLLGLTAICVGLPFAAGRGLPWSGRLLWVYAMLSPLWGFQNPYKYPNFAFNFDQTTGQAFSQIALIPLGVLLIPNKVFKHYRKVFLAVGVFECAALAVYASALLCARSFDSAFVASMMPFAPVFLKIIFAITVLSTSSATGVMIILAHMLAFLRGQKLRYWLAVPAFIGLAYLFQGHKLVDSSGRIVFWKLFFQWWDANELWWTGSRIGVFEWLPRLVKEFQIDERQFLQMHNDWLQMLFEGGVVGLALMVWFYVDLVRRAWTRPILLASLFGFAAFMMTYHPLHFFLSSFFIACVVRETLEPQPLTSRTCT